MTGDAVRAVLERRDAAGLRYGASPDTPETAPEPASAAKTSPATPEWLWLLHDDSAPAPEPITRGRAPKRRRAETAVRE